MAHHLVLMLQDKADPHTSTHNARFYIKQKQQQLKKKKTPIGVILFALVTHPVPTLRHGCNVLTDGCRKADERPDLSCFTGLGPGDALAGGWRAGWWVPQRLCLLCSAANNALLFWEQLPLLSLSSLTHPLPCLTYSTRQRQESMCSMLVIGSESCPPPHYLIGSTIMSVIRGSLISIAAPELMQCLPVFLYDLVLLMASDK